MTSAGADGELQALTSFTVTTRPGLGVTTFDVRQPGRRQPVARLRKPSKGSSRNLPRTGSSLYQALTRPPLYQVLTGPDLTEPAGLVAAVGAATADGTALGGISWWCSRHQLLPDRLPDAGPTRSLPARRLRISRPGLPALVGQPAGLRTWLTFNPVTAMVLDLGDLAGTLIGPRMPLEFRFGGPGSAGFTVTRRVGRASYRLRVADPLLDRRLVLACVLCLDRMHAPGFLQEICDLPGDLAYLFLGR